MSVTAVLCVWSVAAEKCDSKECVTVAIGEQSPVDWRDERDNVCDTETMNSQVSRDLSDDLLVFVRMAIRLGGNDSYTQTL